MTCKLASKLFNSVKNEWNVKLYEVEFYESDHFNSVGKIVTTKKELHIYTIDGYLNIKSLQMPGKKKMEAQQLLNGTTFSDKIIAI